jgi:hypothetical protein
LVAETSNPVVYAGDCLSIMGFKSVVRMVADVGN